MTPHVGGVVLLAVGTGWPVATSSQQCCCCCWLIVGFVYSGCGCSCCPVASLEFFSLSSQEGDEIPVIAAYLLAHDKLKLLRDLIAGHYSEDTTTGR